jgi:acetyl esterase/lipase
MNVKPQQNPPHNLRPVRTEPLMIGSADHIQVCVLRIRVAEALHTCERSSSILRSVNEKHSYPAPSIAATPSWALLIIIPKPVCQDASDPLASPLHADLAGLPPIRVHVGNDEMLLDDSVRFVEHAVAAGVDARVDVGLHGP